MEHNGESAWEAGLAVVRALEKAGHEAYLVGGCVRDRLLGRPLRDIDIATSARPEEVAALFPRVVPTGLKHGTVTVLDGGSSFEVTTFRQEKEYSDSRHPDEVTFVKDIREDLARRDFTINAMAFGSDGSTVDPFGGAEDLRRGVVRCVGDAEERFGEDALRMLRAVRFAAEFGFELEAGTWSGLIARKERLRHVSMERVGSELDKMIGGRDPGRAVSLLAGSGLLACAKEPLPHALPPEEEIYGLSGMSGIAAADLRWAALLAIAGAGPAEALEHARTLRFSAKRGEAIAAVVGLHRRLEEAGFDFAAGDGAGGAEAARTAWIRAALEYGTAAAEGWIALVRALPALAGGDNASAGRAAELAERWLGQMPVRRLQDLALRGDEAVRLANRPPGPWVAATLKRLLELVALGDVPNEPEALKTVLTQVAQKDDER
ncbi:CCA tRNA nucleotidyltransferase [Cohnella thermotolerans]|uniref:CCA tRNA nucleotidyltransferase n=1 Tax=Cohnella thermotolerans TaxID=329858 RepID=UPI000407759B|nr:CCA tRNA nucleotidyltransferase [Cohnella thermotolerans]